MKKRSPETLFYMVSPDSDPYRCYRLVSMVVESAIKQLRTVTNVKIEIRIVTPEAIRGKQFDTVIIDEEVKNK